jgi:hypothetical protein
MYWIAEINFLEQMNERKRTSKHSVAGWWLSLQCIGRLRPQLQESIQTTRAHEYLQQQSNRSRRSGILHMRRHVTVHAPPNPLQLGSRYEM